MKNIILILYDNEAQLRSKFGDRNVQNSLTGQPWIYNPPGAPAPIVFQKIPDNSEDLNGFIFSLRQFGHVYRVYLNEETPPIPIAKQSLVFELAERLGLSKPERFFSFR